MNRFEYVKELLDRSVGDRPVRAHRAFWRGLDRDAFLAKRVYGLQLVDPGNGSESNLVKALRGEAPFGTDVGTAGAHYRRMPAGRPAMGSGDIEFIARWIDDGCPIDEMVAEPIATPLQPTFQLDAGGPVDPQKHNDFWRAFDNWAMFDVASDVDEAIQEVFFPALRNWLGYAMGSASESDWSEAIASPRIKAALTLLSDKQIYTVTSHYGNPIPFLTVVEGFEKFGNNSLPADAERPQDVRHTMNGTIMWFAWSAFADACIRRGVAASFWRDHARNILAGLIHDGLYRKRYRVVGFDASDSQTPQLVRTHVRGLSPDHIQEELAQRFRDTEGLLTG